MASHPPSCVDIWNAGDKCAFSQGEVCAGLRSGYIDYGALTFCSSPLPYWLTTTLLSVWMVLLFFFIGVASSDFFCPNLRVIARALKMSDTLAGVTILAFGNGSPDLFSTYSAFKNGAGSLAIGELVGASMFITTMVIGFVAILSPYKVRRGPFFRDLLFFLGALVVLLGTLMDEVIHMSEGIFMIAYYAVYVIFIMWGEKRRGKSEGPQPEADEMITDPQMNYPDDREPLLGAQSHVRPGIARQAVHVGDFDVDEEDVCNLDLLNMLTHETATACLNMPSQRLPLMSIMELQNTLHSRGLSSESKGALHRHSLDGSPRFPSTTASSSPAPHPNDQMSDLRLSLQRPSREHEITLQQNGDSIDDNFTIDSSTSALSVILAFMSPFTHAPRCAHQSLKRKILTLCLSPPWVFLRVTTPVAGFGAGVDQDKEDFRNCLGPSDNLDVGGSSQLPNAGVLDPREVQSVVCQIMRQRRQELEHPESSRSPTIQAPLYTGQPSAKSNLIIESFQIFFGTLMLCFLFDDVVGILDRAGLATFLVISCGVSSIIVTFFVRMHLKRSSRPSSPSFTGRKTFCLAVFGMLVSLVWISNIANEVVGVLQAVGVALGISHSMLGLTIFAVGNSLSDFIANISVAKMGFPLMAVGACYGSPMLNMMLGVGIAAVRANTSTAGQGDGYPLPLPLPIILAIGGLFVILFTGMTYIPCKNYEISRPYGVALVCMYATLVGAIVLVHVMFPSL